MYTYKPQGIDQEPELVLTSWQVFEVENDTRHFVGLLTNLGRDSRVSSPIQEFDPETMVGITATGRRYGLQGEPELNPFAIQLFDVWCEGAGVKTIRNVTDEYAVGK